MFACLFQSQMLLNQLREITGIQDLQVLQSALNVCLVQQHLSMYSSVDCLTYSCFYSRALEVSAEENAACVKRKRCEGSGESCSPADWIRQEDCPVGIRNVGNTCWFSAVIQSLFHLPVFRRLVLNYCLSERVLEKCKSHSEKRNIAFMQELRCLFALMVGSNRRFVDPSAAVELLRDAFRTSEAQQDVSEFTHKLLDWLEDAFQLAANGNNPEDKQNNPMVQLFYGTFVAERLHEEKIVSNIEQFGQYPLQVNGFNNLDECLEGAMVEGEIELLHSDQTMSSGQERWFSKLPPVLTFELSRFEFNQSLGRPEKIHKKLEFPQVVYMDRYLHKNVDQTHGRRGEVKRLKDQLTVLQQKLEGYKNYGSGPTKYPLADMLQYVLEFATTKPTNVCVTNLFNFCCSQTEPDDAGSSDGSGCPQTATQRTPIHKPFTQCRPPIEVPLQPAPHSVTEEELYFVRSCLQRWRAEVENTINELKASIDKVSQALEGMYSDNSLCQVPYRLHAVLVHEGQASAGHYWAYIYDHANKRWLKYNDVMVTESTWEELVRDSYGGMTNASAYCLMYINDKLPYLIAEDTDNETGQVLKGMDSLPSILRRYVREDNRWFQQELREWEEQFSIQLKNTLRLNTPNGATSQFSYIQIIIHINLDIKLVYLVLYLASLPCLFLWKSFGSLHQAFHEEYSRLYELSQEETTPQQDPRLQHVLIYFFQNQAPNRVIERTLLEQFADRNLSFDDRAISIMREARSKIRLIKPEDMDMAEYLVKSKRHSTLFFFLNELNENAATLFKSQDENDVAEAVTIMNECIIPCMHLMVRDSISQEDLDVIELIRSCWCSYLGQDMDDSVQEKLSEFLPRVLDCSAEMVVLKEPPKVRNSPHDLCSRLTAVMESIHSTSVVTVK
uniref:Ubiquitin carboxyl-terminal hydrolase n=1 Tax=Sinocyclocheilus grahami TaxID=75366 RepID=A0A672SAF1_SINGR